MGEEAELNLEIKHCFWDIKRAQDFTKPNGKVANNLLIAYTKLIVQLTNTVYISWIIYVPELFRSCEEKICQMVPWVMIHSGIFHICLAMWILSLITSLDFLSFISPTLYLLKQSFGQDFELSLYILFVAFHFPYL
jgi:hypothetical protein